MENKKFVYQFLNCDEWKSYSSMNVSTNDAVFSNSKRGRTALWNVIKTELKKTTLRLNQR